MNTKAISQNLSKKMQDWDATDKSVAEMIGVTDRAVFNWRTGKRQPTAYGLLRLSRLFGCTMEELMEGVDE